MGRIKNITTYPFDEDIRLDDYVIGTDVTTGITKNFTFAQIFEMFKQNLNPYCNSTGMIGDI